MAHALNSEMGNLGCSQGFRGLSLGSIKVKNLGLLLKWWFRFCNEGELLWKNVISLVHSFPNKILTLVDVATIKHDPFQEIPKATKNIP